MIPGMMKDKMPGQGVQPWSVGDIYPLVIARVERYVPPKRVVIFDSGNSYDLADGEVIKSWNVLNADDDMEGFASYDDAFAAAKGYLAARVAVKPVLSPFNPAAYDADLAADLIEDERMSLPEPGYGNRFYDNGNGSGVMSAELDLDLARNKAIAAARDLYRRLGETMTWSDRDKGFDEWNNLGDALKALNIAREEASNA